MQAKLIQEHFELAKRIVKEAGERKGVPEFPTGLNCLDELTGGFKRGEIWIIAGKAGSGKTSLGLQLARSFADNPEHSVCFLTLEMRGWELVLRMYSEMMNECYTDMVIGRQGIEPEKEKNFRIFLDGIDFEIIEYGYNWDEVLKVFDTFYKTKKPDVVFLDFIQLISWKEFKDERMAIMEYIRKLKEIANKHNIGFVVVSQLRRLPSGADYQREPDMTDLSGSGALEQVCDKICMIFKKTEGEKTEHYLNLIKNRQGQTKKMLVQFEGKYYRFKDNISTTVKPYVTEDTQKIIKQFGGSVVDD